MITRHNSSDPLYTMYLPTRPVLPTTPPMALVAFASTWHRHLRHLGLDALLKLSNVCCRL
jgi:hypothetical protein